MEGYKQYRLDVDDMIVEVWQFGDYGHWKYSVVNKDGSGCKTNWFPTERDAKMDAKAVYNTTGHRSPFRPKEHRLPILKRAKWIKVEYTH
ncbi:hypothetical protein LCGC14_0579890 [marine sediment metagenome]|uniref:Uncharacterized protein n=1 Tax=marine sediment metagenome TaxID=412755 RepID=A0A0F9S0C1_9ZZZZ